MRNLLNPGVFALGFYNPTDEVKVPISGQDIAPSSTLEKTVLTRGVSSGGGVTQLNYKWELVLQFADSVAFDDLQSISSNSDTRLEIWKTNGFVTWRNPTEVFVDESVITDPESEDYPYTARMTFIGPDPFIKESLNYLAPWEGVEERPWTVTGDYSSLSFDGTTQTVNTDASGTIEISTDIYLPFESSNADVLNGQFMQAFIDIDTLPTNADVRAVRTSYGFSGTIGSPLSTDVTSTGTLNLTGINSGLLVQYVEVKLIIENLTEATTFEFSNPYAVRDRNDGLTNVLNEFTNY